MYSHGTAARMLGTSAALHTSHHLLAHPTGGTANATDAGLVTATVSAPQAGFLAQPAIWQQATTQPAGDVAATQTAMPHPWLDLIGLLAIVSDVVVALYLGAALVLAVGVLLLCRRPAAADPAWLPGSPTIAVDRQTFSTGVRS